MPKGSGNGESGHQSGKRGKKRLLVQETVREEIVIKVGKNQEGDYALRKWERGEWSPK